MDRGEAIGMMAGAYFVGRAELLRWINNLTSLNYTKIEQTANGVFVCHVFDALFPNVVKMEKVKFNARQQYEYVHNYKILQAAFNKLNLKKQIGVEKLIKGKYQDNLEFIQWVKAFYDQHASENALNYDGRARREAILAKTGDVSRPLHTSNRNRVESRPTRTGYTSAPAKAGRSTVGSTRQTAPTVRKAEYDALVAENEALNQTILDGDNEREFYFGKLRKVEIIVQDAEDYIEKQEEPVDPFLLKAIEDIKVALYAEDNGEPQAGHEGDADPATPPEGEEDPYDEQDLLPEEVAHQASRVDREY